MKLKIARTVATLLVTQVSILADNTTKLDDIQVVTTASGYEQKLTDAPASITVITKEDLAKKPYTNLLDAVKDIEGVDIGETTDKSGQGTVSMRGMGADYTLVLIDGKKQNNNGDIYPNDFGGLQFANIPPLSMIERIEVVRGPMSTLYGADAMGGVINIITKKISKEWTGSISHSRTFQTDSAWGNQDTTDVSIMGPLIENKLGLSLRGSYYDKEKSAPQWDTVKDLDGVSDYNRSNSSFGGNGKTMDNQNWAFGAGLTFTPNDTNTIKADFDVSKQKYDNTNGDVGTVDSYNTIYTNQRVGYAPIQRMQREQYALSWESNWDLGKSTIGVHHVETANLGRSLPLNASERAYIKANKASWGNLAGAMNDPVFVGLMPRPERTLESSNTTYNAKYEVPLSNHFLVVGTEYLQSELEDGVYGMSSDSETKSGVTKDYSQWSVFAEDNWSIIDPLTLTTGVRYDKHDDFGSHVSPRAYLVYDLSESWTLKGGVATGYKTPKTTDLQEGVTGFGGQGTSPWVGNPDLKPEESLSKEIAAYYNHEDGHAFNVTYFQNDFKDKIESVTVADNQLPPEWSGVINDSFSQKQNVGEAEIRGIELAGKYQILDNLAIKLNYTFTDSEIKSDDAKTNGKPLRSSPEHMYNATLDWQTTAKLNTYLTYSGEKERFNTRNTTNLKDYYYKDYSVWNMGTSYKVDKSLTINARVNNLFDKDFMEYGIADKVGTTYIFEEYSNKSASRNFWLSANYTF
jgi:outer membrane receptor for ferrienterochelin and colicins